MLLAHHEGLTGAPPTTAGAAPVVTVRTSIELVGSSNTSTGASFSGQGREPSGLSYGFDGAMTRRGTGYTGVTSPATITRSALPGVISGANGLTSSQ